MNETSVPRREPTRILRGSARSRPALGAWRSLGSALGSSISLVACSSGAVIPPAAGALLTLALGATGVVAAGRTVPVAPVTASVALPPSELVTRTVPGLATLVNWPL